MKALLGAILLMLPSSLLGQTGTRLAGRVLGPDGREPLVGAAVTLNGLRAVTNARGVFVIASAPSGKHLIQIELLGYQPRSDSVDITPDGFNEVTIRLAQKPIPLPPLLVTVRSRTLVENGFYERRDSSGLSGRFIERAEIERRNPTFLTDLFYDVTGARVVNGYSRRVIQFNRENNRGVVPTLERRPNLQDPFENWLVHLPGCQPDVFVDGRHHYDRVIRGIGAYVDDFNLLSAAVIEAIEVYVGASTPTQYRGNGCGVILIWTRKN